ncbi:hypothetical protein [Catenulispora acidiphila]|uniref:hypothetical protein n=1 Tax=Catenulispora acidiphila TaxID=304895 RepID=UPI00117FCD74|nr:hypothetical protein [Catenulispora acidiphila]
MGDSAVSGAAAINFWTLLTEASGAEKVALHAGPELAEPFKHFNAAVGNYRNAADVACYLYGINDGVPKSYEETAVRFNTSVKVVKSVEGAALDLIRMLRNARSPGSNDDQPDVLDELRDLAAIRYFGPRGPRPLRKGEDRPDDPWNGQSCLVCNSPLPYAGTGRPRSTCSSRCRQRLYRLRKNGIQPSQISPEPDHVPAAAERPRTHWAPRHQTAGYVSFEEAAQDFRDKVAELQVAVAKPYSLMVGHQVYAVWESGWYFSTLLRDQRPPTTDAASSRAVLTALARIIDELGRLAEADDDYGRAQWHNSTQQKAVSALAKFARIATKIVGLCDDLSRARSNLPRTDYGGAGTTPPS